MDSKLENCKHEKWLHHFESVAPMHAVSYFTCVVCGYDTRNSRSNTENTENNMTNTPFESTTLYGVNIRLMELESKIGGVKKKQMEKLEERIKRLEESCSKLYPVNTENTRPAPTAEPNKVECLIPSKSSMEYLDYLDWLGGNCCSGYPNCIHKPSPAVEVKHDGRNSGLLNYGDGKNGCLVGESLPSERKPTTGTNCPVCGTACTIEGKTTLHYEPIPPECKPTTGKGELDEKELSKYLSGIIFDYIGSTGTAQSVRTNDLAKAICQKLSPRSIKLPEFKHVCGDFNGVSFREGWNACLEAVREMNKDK